MEEIIELNFGNLFASEIVEDNTSREAFSVLEDDFIGTNENIDTSDDIEEVAEELEIDTLVVSDEDTANENKINRIDGTRASDGIVGTEQDDIINALEGDDFIVGDPGLNSIGNDTIDGGSGNDNIIGKGGNDSLIGGFGDDNIFGDADLNTNPDDGGFGDDTLIGDDGKDFLDGGVGNDFLDGGRQDDDLFGGDGEDNLLGGRGNDNLFGGKDNDVINGNTGKDRIFGEEGDDTLYGGNANDTLYGDRFAQIVGGSARDSLLGERGNDTLYGGVGSDILDGGSDNDRLFGVDPSFNVDFGRSTIDTLTGGSGNDIFVLGDRDTVFYDSGIPGNEGTRDYALITDYEFGLDRLDIAGSQNDYVVEFTSGSLPDGLGVYYQPTAGDRELIAIVETDSTFPSFASTGAANANIETGNSISFI